MNPLVECVPNFSEGRHREIIDEVVAVIASVSGVHVLDVHCDPDHNRSVVTLAGQPQAVSEAAFQGIAAGARLINLEDSRGQHPRLGAADVVPFVPLRGTTLADCVALARTVGQRVGDELGLPVYLYAAAATRPERVNLADIRRGEYERLKQTIGIDSTRAPDYGPSQVGPAGAVIIGARPFLVAFNVNLTTADLSIARAIARTVRASSGGLAGVKALGLSVAGRAQVSMNLTDIERTPIHRAVELIRQEARRYGVGVAGSELVGLIPQQALLDAAAWYLGLPGLSADQIIENHLAEL